MPPFSEESYDGSAIPALLALAAKLRSHEVAMKRYRKVNFAREPQVKPVDVIPFECRASYWLSKDEFDDIKKDCAAVVERSKVDRKVETRGLESSVMTGEAFLQCYLHRRGAQRAVFKEQLFQKETGYSDADDIAEAYVAFSKKSIGKAREKAVNDELAVRLQ